MTGSFIFSKLCIHLQPIRTSDDSFRTGLLLQFISTFPRYLKPEVGAGLWQQSRACERRAWAANLHRHLPLQARIKNWGRQKWTTGVNDQ